VLAGRVCERRCRPAQRPSPAQQGRAQGQCAASGAGLPAPPAHASGAQPDTEEKACAAALPAGAQEFLPELALLVAEPAQDVRRALAELLGAAAAAVPPAPALAAALSALQALLGDASPAVAKRAALAAIGAFRAALARVAADGRPPSPGAAAAAALWDAARGLKARLAALATEAGPDGVRLAAAKFLETAVLLLSADLPPPAPGAPAPRPLGAGHAVLRPMAVRGAAGPAPQLRLPPRAPDPRARARGRWRPRRRSTCCSWRAC